MTYGYDIRNLSENDVRRISVEETRRVIGSTSSLGSYAPGSIPNDAVRRAYTRVYLQPTSAADYTVSATSLTELDPALAGTIDATGAPILIIVNVRGVQAGTSSELALGVRWDNTDLGGEGGSWATEATDYQGACFMVVVPTPRPGKRRFALTASRTSADGTVYCGDRNMIELVAVEV